MSDELDISIRGAARDRSSLAWSSDRAPIVYVAAPVVAAVDRHVAGDTSIEQGGVLVGFIDEQQARILITGAIEARGAVATVASLTFTHETWEYVDSVQERDYPRTLMLGWYHSHPRFGIFLSPHDLFIHRNFFRQPWQIAYVVDPIAHERGFFAWARNDIERCASWRVLEPPDEPPKAP